MTDHEWLKQQGWTRIADLRRGNRIIAQWTHAAYGGRVFNTDLAVYAEQKRQERKAAQ